MSDVSYTLNHVEQHGVCYNSWDVQSKHIQPMDGIAEALYSGECRYGGGESYILAYGIDQQGGKGNAGFAKDVSPTMASDSHGTPHAVCYGIGSYGSNAWKSSNPHSGVYEAETARTLDHLQCGNPSCNQGGVAIVEQRDVRE